MHQVDPQRVSKRMCVPRHLERPGGSTFFYDDIIERRSPWAGARIGEPANLGPAGPYVAWDDSSSEEDVPPQVEEQLADAVAVEPEVARAAVDAAAPRAMPLNAEAPDAGTAASAPAAFFDGLREEVPAEDAFPAGPFDVLAFRKVSISSANLGLFLGALETQAFGLGNSSAID